MLRTPPHHNGATKVALPIRFTLIFPAFSRQKNFRIPTQYMEISALKIHCEGAENSPVGSEALASHLDSSPTKALEGDV